MSTELRHAGLLELGCLIDLGWVQTSAWLTINRPARQPAHPPPNEDFAAAVVFAADRLPVDQARALWLVDVCGATDTQGAAESGTTKKFAKRVHTARHTIRRALT